MPTARLPLQTVATAAASLDPHLFSDAQAGDAAAHAVRLQRRQRRVADSAGSLRDDGGARSKQHFDTLTLFSELLRAISNEYSIFPVVLGVIPDRLIPDFSTLAFRLADPSLGSNYCGRSVENYTTDSVQNVCSIFV
jgi:hypothetical protein